MSIFVLPNELLEQIIWQISSDDIENFSATSRLLRTLAAPYLKEHFHLKSQYGYSINYPTKRPFHPADLLSAIVENPKIAFYVKALSLTFRPALSPTRSNPSWERTQALITRHNGFLDQLHGTFSPSPIETLLYFSITDKLHFRNTLDTGSRNQHVAQQNIFGKHRRPLCPSSVLSAQSA